MRMVCVALALLSTAAPANAARVDVASVESSSTLPGSAGVSYEPGHLVDNKQSTVWVEGDTNGSGMGTTVTLHLAQETTLTSMRIWNGNWYTHDFWTRHNRVQDIEIIFSDESREVHTLGNTKVVELVQFESPRTTTFVRLRIKSIYRGSTFNDTVLSEVQLFDRNPMGDAQVSSWEDSTHLEEDGDGSYEPPNMWDGVLDSMWCDSSEGDGTGEWIEFDFGMSERINAIRLVNGDAYDLMTWMKSNRVTQATLSFSDGSSQQIDVRNSIREQTVPIRPVTTRRVRLTVTEVKRGSQAANDPAYDCVCISEAAFVK